jgi:beta-glucosidase
VSIAAGASTTVEINLSERDLAFWHIGRHDWAVALGPYEIQVGASSRDIRLRSPLEVRGDSPELESPYSAEVELAYAAPPRGVPAEFAQLVHPSVATDGGASRRLDMETRLQDARGTIVGNLLYRTMIGALHRQYRRARALPPSPERDARIKSAYFLWRMMPNMSLRGMVMASSGRLPLALAAGLVALSRGRLIRAISLFIRRPIGQEALR